jgi:hypothetical protein
MSSGSVLFGLLLLQAGVLLARPGIVELRSRHDRPRSAQIRALRFVVSGAILCGLGAVLFLDAVGWAIGRTGAEVGSLAAVGALLCLSAAELMARLGEDREGRLRQRELGLAPLDQGWQPAVVVLLWTLLVPAAGIVACAIEIALHGWGFAAGARGELIDALVLACAVAFAMSHVACHRRLRRRRQRALRERERGAGAITARRDG